MPESVNRPIGILTAVREEFAAIAKLMNPICQREVDSRSVFEGEIEGHPAVLICSGMGPDRASFAADLLARSYAPMQMLTVGFAASLSSRIHCGDIVIAVESMAYGKEREALSSSPLHISSAKFGLPGFDITAGAVISHSSIVCKSEEKLHISSIYPDALALDMETESIARISMQNNISWRSVRCISDELHESLPFDFNAMIGFDGELSRFGLALSAMAHPRAIPGLLRLGKNAALAADHLHKFVKACFQNNLFEG
jgi:adenosylhomocysteine nucleosidase